jgi:anti-sigma regulatory factor (Ser/Thr protein kinase)
VQSQTVYTKSWVLPSTVPAVGEVCRQLLEQIRRQAFEERDAFAIHLALEEALTNAVKHGNHDDPDHINRLYDYAGEIRRFHYRPGKRF